MEKIKLFVKSPQVSSFYCVLRRLGCVFSSANKRMWIILV